MHTVLFSHSKDILYTLSGSFIGLLGGAFGFVFLLTVQARVGGLRFNPRVSYSPRWAQVSAKLFPR